LNNNLDIKTDYDYLNHVNDVIITSCIAIHGVTQKKNHRICIKILKLDFQNCWTMCIPQKKKGIRFMQGFSTHSQKLWKCMDPQYYYSCHFKYLILHRGISKDDHECETCIRKAPSFKCPKNYNMS
jgi:hypothetical protein